MVPRDFSPDGFTVWASSLPGDPQQCQGQREVAVWGANGDAFDWSYATDGYLHPTIGGANDQSVGLPMSQTLNSVSAGQYIWLIFHVDAVPSPGNCYPFQINDIDISGSYPVGVSSSAKVTAPDWTLDGTARSQDDQGSSLSDYQAADSLAFADPQVNPAEQIDLGQLAQVGTAAQTDFGTRFAGTDTNQLSNTISVFVTGTLPTDPSTTSALQSLTTSNVRLVSGQTFSWADLVAAQSHFSDEVDASPSLLNVFVSSTIDRSKNRVVITLEGSNTDDAVILAVSAPDALANPMINFVNVPTGSGVQLSATDGYEAYPPAEAAKRVRGSAYGACTSGWVMWDSQYNRYYWSTAGHCSDVGQQLRTGYNNGIVVGHVYQKVYGKSDVLLVPIRSVDATNRIYAGSGTAVPVSGIYPSQYLTTSVPVYDRGARTGGHKGSVLQGYTYPQSLKQKFVDPSNGATLYKVVNNLFCTGDMKVGFGDSGGPAWVDNNNGRNVAGLISGSLDAPIEDQNGNTTGYQRLGSCFAGAAGIRAALGSYYQFWVSN